MGRYFPLTLVQPIHAANNSLSLLHKNESWFTQLEDIAFGALEQQLDADAMEQALQQLPACHPGLHNPGQMFTGQAIAASGGEHESSITDAYSQLLASQLPAHPASHSVWWSNGSQHMAPSLLITPGLPDPQAYTGMLDGNFGQWGWAV